MSKTNTKLKISKKISASAVERKPSMVFCDGKQNLLTGPFLYRTVYAGKLSLFVVLMLLASFLLPGVAIVSASEDAEPLHIIDQKDQETEVSTAAAEAADSVVSMAIETVVDSPTSIDPEPVTLPVEEPPEVISDPEEEVVSSSTDEQAIDPDFTETGDIATTTTEVVEDEQDSNLTAVPATTTTLVEEEIPSEQPITITYSDAEVTFSKDECTELASGSFYCLQPNDNQLDDALFSAPDQDGDLEIFLVRSGEQTQVTQNTVDDAAPFYDTNSDSIVWHRLLDDRYQIISYDIETGKETQLSFNNTNNMEPTRQGKYTVWQRWVGNNWNVVLHDGNKETIITESSAHDIAPYIHGSLVVWNRYSGTSDKTIEMYDIGSETYVTVDDPEGLSVTNPRMVFVYDSLNPNGDVVTKGYDMIARKFIQLGSLPKELPDEIPNSDSTGETRALIQSKPTVKSDEVLTPDFSSGNNDGPDTASSSVVSATTTGETLDLSGSAGSSQAIAVVETAAPTDFDLVITPYREMASGTVSVQE